MKKFIIIFIITFLVFNLSALKIPALKGRVNDYANVLISTEEEALERLLKKEEEKTSSQYALLIIPGLEGENLEDYSLRVAEQWGIGQKDRDNGVLLLIAMKEKQLRIEVGYGLESIITDVKSGYIIRSLIVPEFKKNNYFQGIAMGLSAITGLVSNEYEISPEELAQYKKKEQRGKRSEFPVSLIFMLIIVIGNLGRRRRGGLLPLLLFGSSLGGRSSGRSGFGGGGFGGFSGGGGGFGGGGASGGW